MSFWSPHIKTDDFLERGKFILAWRLTILFLFAFLVLVVVFFNGSAEEFYTYSICVLLAVVSLIYLKKTHKSHPIYWFLAVSGTIIAAYTVNNFTELIHYGDFFWMVLIIAFAFFGLGVKEGVLFLVLNIATIIYYVFSTVNINIESTIPLNAQGKIALVVELVVAIICISYVIYQFVSMHKQAYSKLLQANEELIVRNETIEHQNEEKTTLVKEIHHRVKNNLQIIISLLRLQKSELKSEEAKRQFSQAINRILVMSLIHRKLYQGDALSKVRIQSYLQELSDDIKSLSDTGFRTKISVSSEIERVGLKTIVPLGLLINELVSNSIKHAFPEKKSGEINIQITCKNDLDFTLKYADNGTWREESSSNSSFGVELIKILAEQMDGDFKRTSDESGTTYLFSLKNIDIENSNYE
ncbi:MAG: hypothetical protein COA33_015080 [Fluviicola sp.]|nr:hypothetical protein [Fluviicola sp.]